MKRTKIIIALVAVFLTLSLSIGIQTVKGEMAKPGGEKCIGHDCLIVLPLEEYGYPCDELIEGGFICCHGLSFETFGHVKS